MKPIILQTAQVRGILDGRVTAFRVPLKPQPNHAHTVMGYENGIWSLMCGHIENGTCIDWEECVKAPYDFDDILYVREAWRPTIENYGYDETGELEIWEGPPYFYKADGGVSAFGWRSSATMPRDAARLFLRVVDVRVERVQDANLWTVYVEFERCEKEES